MRCFFVSLSRGCFLFLSFLAIGLSQKPELFPWVLDGFLKRLGSLSRERLECLGPPGANFLANYFGWPSFRPLKADYREKPVPTYSNLSTGGPSSPSGFSTCGALRFGGQS